MNLNVFSNIYGYIHGLLRTIVRNNLLEIQKVITTF